MRVSTALLALLASSAAAAPLESNVLVARGGHITYDRTCNEAPPKDSVWAKAEFKTMKDVLVRLYSGVEELARTSIDHGSAENKGFTHYFQPGNFPTYKKMMEGIADSEIHYKVEFVCTTKKSEKCHSDMITDGSPGDGTKQIEVCPQFWSSKSSYLLPITNEQTPSPPYRPSKEGDKNSWCAQARHKKGEEVLSKLDANSFSTAEATLLHELTHLNSLGLFAGVPPNTDHGVTYHGTYNHEAYSTPTSARKLHQRNVKDPKDGPLANAESYAAAAGEIYFMEKCKFAEISPKEK